MTHLVHELDMYHTHSRNQLVYFFRVAYFLNLQARTQGGCPGCPGNHLFVLKYLIWLNENIILFDISFIKGLVKGRLTNENNKRTIADAEIFDNRNGPQVRVGYDQAL